MPWQVVWSEQSVKQLKKLDKKTAQRIYDTVLDCSQDPSKKVTRLTNSPFFLLRVGDYRVIMDLQQAKMFIFVI